MRLVIFTALCLAGCDGGQARTFAATLTDATETSCRGVTRHAAFEQDTLDEIAEDLEEAYADRLLETGAPTIGRTLRLVERSDEVRAWFEVEGASGEAVFFAHAGVVYRGPPQDGFIEARFALTENDDLADEEAGLELCGERLHAEGVLSLTDGDGVQGRIRWRDRLYLDAAPSRCLAFIDCSRSIAVDGLPLD